MKSYVIAASVVVASVMACGGLTSPDSDGGSGDGGPMTDGLGSDSGWTNCSSPDGVMICGGPNDCNSGTACASYCGGACNGVQPCGSNAVVDNFSVCDNPPCPDGTLIFPTCTAKFTDVPLIGACVVDQVGQLFHRNGADSVLMYADFSAYNGTPVPQPSSCPTITGLTLCGGACGSTCPNDSTHVCYGRSPKHPYSLCTINGGSCSTADQTDCTTYGQSNKLSVGCLIFSDDAASQTNADAHGICVDAPTCAAASSSYPGGAKCIAL
jgi:hypothetical protein